MRQAGCCRIRYEGEGLFVPLFQPHTMQRVCARLKTGTVRREILRYQLLKLEMKGFEPSASDLRSLRSPN